MTNNTINNVPRELLERARAAVASTNTSNWSSDLLRDIHAILSAPSPAGVDGLDVVSNWVLFDAEADKPYIKKMLPEGFLAFFDCEEDARRAKANNPGTDYKRIDRVKAEDAQAIIDGLRGEVAELKQSAQGKLILRLYQHAKRIGELEGLLRHAQKQVPTGSGLHMRIDSALSAGKEGE